MRNPITAWQKNNQIQRQQDMKARIVKNKEGVYDILNEWTKSAKGCPFLLLEKCKGIHCEHFQQYTSRNDQTGEETKYFRCVFNQLPHLQIELIQNIQAQNKLLKEVLERGALKS
jgi:hypothetical protein